MSKIIIEAGSFGELSSLLAQFGFVPSGGITAGALIGAHSPTITSAIVVQTADDDESGPVNAAAPNVDTRGVPHDERIHSKNKTTNADGTWRTKKGVKQPEIDAVEAELRSKLAGATLGVSTTVPMPQLQVQTQQPVQQMQPQQVVQQQPQMQPQMQQPVQQVQQVQQQPMQQMQPQQVVQQQPVQQVQGGGMDFSTFMQGVSRGMQTDYGNGVKVIDAAYLAKLSNFLQVSSITDLSMRPDLVPTAFNQIVADGRWIAAA